MLGANWLWESEEPQSNPTAVLCCGLPAFIAARWCAEHSAELSAVALRRLGGGCLLGCAVVLAARKSRRAAGRLTRSKLLLKRSHSGGHWPVKKLDNVVEDLGKTSYLQCCILEKHRFILVKICKKIADYGNICEKFKISKKQHTFS